MSHDNVLDAAYWQKLITAWLTQFCRAPPTGVVHVQQCTASGEYALQYECSWPSQHAPRDFSSLSTHMQTELGPLTRIVTADLSHRKLTIGVLPMPDGAARKLNAHMRSTTKKLHAKATSRFSATHAWLLVLVCGACVVYTGAQLHNHWHPYHGAYDALYEYIHYHVTTQV